MRREFIENGKPSTYRIRFIDNTPSVFRIYNEKGDLYFYRYMPQGQKSIKINIPDIGNYYFNANAIVERSPISINSNVYKIKLPAKERNRRKDYFIVHDENETESPAIIFTKEGRIITGSKFKKLTIPMKQFILLHELGHFDYKTEKFCDLFATVEFIKMGHNPSTAMYCLVDVLRKHPQNDERIRYVFNKLKQSGLA